MMPHKPLKPFFLTTADIFLVSLLTVILDQFSKFLIRSHFICDLSFPVINGIFHITLTLNKGAAFGLFKGGTSIFIFISFLCISVIILLLRRNALLERFFGFSIERLSVRLAFGLILGGACGNLIDRLRYGYVVDFLDFRRWPVFNLADSAISVGGVIIFLVMLTDKKKGYA